MFPDLGGSFDEVLAQLEGFEFTPEMIDTLTQFVLLSQLQNQAGQQQIQQQQIGLEGAQLDFQREHQLPFQREQLENQRLIAELGLEGRNIDLQSQRELADIRARQQEAELGQLQERGEFQTLQEGIAQQTAMINLALQRERLAAEQGLRGRRAQFTPSGASMSDIFSQVRSSS